jgi:cytochrome o ubiquinol oxidase subunit 3
MSAVVIHDPAAYMTARERHDEHAHANDTGANTVLGFWIYLMSDCLLFASLFAAYAVLYGNTAGGASGKALFELPYVAVETLCLLSSSVTYGMAMLAMNRSDRSRVITWLGVTFLFGLAFIGMELNEFHHLIAQGHGPNRSAFLSSFFTLVGTHGLHVASGLLWMAVMIVQIAGRGLTERVRTRLMCLSLFWHFLDIVWICVFTVVYLMGSLP